MAKTKVGSLTKIIKFLIGFLLPLAIVSVYIILNALLGQHNGTSVFWLLLVGVELGFIYMYFS